MSDRISFELNGETVEALSGETIWQVADRLGTEIPHLCWQPEKDYRADGNCRACMVEVEGERTLVASCIREPSEGMKVTTDSARAKSSESEAILDTFTPAAGNRTSPQRSSETSTVIPP